MDGDGDVGSEVGILGRMEGSEMGDVVAQGM